MFCTTKANILTIIIAGKIRSYYRCTNPRCNAKKQVERSSDDPDTLIITYEGLHLHFTYPFSILGQAQDSSQSQATKKPKQSNYQAQEHEPQQTQETQESSQGMDPMGLDLGSASMGYHHEESAQEERGSQGLLQDVVPLMILNPSSNNNTSSHSSCSSNRSPPTSPSSLSWPPNYSTASCLGIGINSSIS